MLLKNGGQIDYNRNGVVHRKGAKTQRIKAIFEIFFAPQRLCG